MTAKPRTIQENQTGAHAPLRSLADLLETLPFRQLGANPVVDVNRLPNDVLPHIEVEWSRENG